MILTGAYPDSFDFRPDKSVLFLLRSDVETPALLLKIYAVFYKCRNSSRYISMFLEKKKTLISLKEIWLLW